MFPGVRSSFLLCDSPILHIFGIMKRIGLISTLFFIAFVFTQCGSDDCRRGGPGTISEPSPTGLSILSSQFLGESTIPYIGVEIEYLFAQNNSQFSLINSAYACSTREIPGDYSISRLVDSISVVSVPRYNLELMDEQLLIYLPDGDYFMLNSFNDFQERGGQSSQNDYLEYSLLEKPTQSDSFTFAFYYYKDGTIIDSSFTQNFYIRRG